MFSLKGKWKEKTKLTFQLCETRCGQEGEIWRSIALFSTGTFLKRKSLKLKSKKCKQCSIKFLRFVEFSLLREHCSIHALSKGNGLYSLGCLSIFTLAQTNLIMSFFLLLYGWGAKWQNLCLSINFLRSVREVSCYHSWATFWYFFSGIPHMSTFVRHWPCGHMTTNGNIGH